AQLHVRPHGDGVVSLSQWVQELVNLDGHAALEAFGEVVALEHPGDRVMGGQLDEIGELQLTEPLGVEAQLEPVGIGIEDGHRLSDVGLTVGARLLESEYRPGLRAAGRVPYHRGEVADDEDDLVAQVLELPELPEHHGMSDVEVGRRRVYAQLRPQLTPLALRELELLAQATFGNDLIGSALQEFLRGGDTVHGHARESITSPPELPRPEGGTCAKFASWACPWTSELAGVGWTWAQARCGWPSWRLRSSRWAFGSRTWATPRCRFRSRSLRDRAAQGTHSTRTS